MSNAIVFYEKHGETVYDASTKELRAGAFLEVLTDRFNDGWYPQPPEPEFTPEELELEAHDADLIPNPFRDLVLKTQRRLKSVRKEFEDEQRFYNRVKTIVEMPPAWAIYVGHETPRGRFISDAEELIAERIGYEYEGYEEVPLRKVEY